MSIWLEKISQQPTINTDSILLSLYEYYLKDNNINKILPILTSNSIISIRVLDWFVTNYSKKYNIIYKSDEKDIQIFNVYLQYKSQLKGYRKKLFDPFCRNKRIFFYYEENKCVVTTIGQLNFFRWSIKYNILEYVEKNLTLICNDMNKSIKNYIKKNITSEDTNDTESDKYIKSDIKSEISDDINMDDDDVIIMSYALNKQKNDIYKNSIKKNKKRHELSENKNKTINKINLDIVINFD